MMRPTWLRRRAHTLPLRLWLIVVVVAVTGAGFLSQVGLTQVLAVWDQQAEDARLASVRQILGTDAARWSEPSWQRQALEAFGPLNVEVAVFAGPNGKSVYATPGASDFLLTSAVSTSAASAAPRVRSASLSQQTSGSRASPTVLPEFERIVISASRPSSAGEAVVGVAFLWLTGPPPGEPSQLLWPAVELGTFALTLAIVVWLMGQPVLRPLTEMSQAVEGIAGGELHVHLPQSPVGEIANVSEALEGMSGTLREALASQAALEEQRRLFVGAIAHDLRTPLFMLRGHLKGLESGVASTPEKMARYIDACRVQADALERLIADLFAYTRLEYLEQEPERAPLELGDLLRRTVEAVRPRAEDKGIALVTDAPAEACPVLGDARLLARAVGNLLDNAIRHTPEGGDIHVHWSRGEDHVRFSVEDSGPGIAARDLAHLFTPLYRREASRNRETGGAGLGLTIARRILRAHGGDLTAANGADGGAVFTGTLPSARRPATPAPDLAAANGR